MTDPESGKMAGKHYGSPAGPVWEVGEGEKTLTVIGAMAKKADAKEGNLPWLLIEVKDIKIKDKSVKDIPGAPFPFSYIQRVDTEGGVAPAKAPSAPFQWWPIGLLVIGVVALVLALYR